MVVLKVSWCHLLLPRHGVHAVPHAEDLRGERAVGGGGGAAEVRVGRRAERGKRPFQPHPDCQGALEELKEELASAVKRARA